jgi:hypothetical protein
MKTLMILILVSTVPLLGVDSLLTNHTINVEIPETQESEQKEFFEEDLILIGKHKASALLSTFFYPSSYTNYTVPILSKLTRPPKFST